jgi:hypothetical protein
VHVEYLAAGTLPEAMRRLARSIAGRFKPLASLPQRVFSGGPISLIAQRLKSASVRFDKNICHAHSKSARASSNVAAVSD